MKRNRCRTLFPFVLICSSTTFGCKSDAAGSTNQNSGGSAASAPPNALPGSPGDPSPSAMGATEGTADSDVELADGGGVVPVVFGGPAGATDEADAGQAANASTAGKASDEDSVGDTVADTAGETLINGATTLNEGAGDTTIDDDVDITDEAAGPSSDESASDSTAGDGTTVDDDSSENATSSTCAGGEGECPLRFVCSDDDGIYSCVSPPGDNICPTGPACPEGTRCSDVSTCNAESGLCAHSCLSGGAPFGTDLPVGGPCQTVDEHGVIHLCSTRFCSSDASAICLAADPPPTPPPSE